MTSSDDPKKTSFPPYPEESANFFSRMIFWWIQDILIKGSKSPLQESDVFACPTKLESKTVTNRVNYYWAKEKRKKKPSLGRALVKANLKILIKILIQCVIESIFLLAPTVLVSKVSSYFDPNSTITQREALIYGCVLFAMNAGYVAVRNALYWNLHRLGPTMRIQASTLVYNKACMVSFSALSKTSIGHVITLMSNDAERFDEGFVPMHGVVNIPLTFIVAFILSYYTIGIYSTLTAFGTVLLFIPIQFYIGKGVQACRRKAVPHTDKRIKLINETIASMKIIKMYKWESVFRNFIFKVRALETKYVGVFMLLKSSSIAIKFISPLLGLFALLLTKYLTGQTINSEMVFFFLMMAQLLRQNINWSLGAAFLYIPQFSHSLGRIQRFLLIEEQATADATLCIENINVDLKNGSVVKEGCQENGDKANYQEIEEVDPEVSLKINNLTSTWGGENRFVLSDVNMEVRKKILVGILGPVGCGKSSIIMSLIQEMERVSGSIFCPSAIGFYSQVPWIFNGSVRENILFNRPMNEEKLEKIIEACYLTQDLEDLANGLETIVGERGVQLSGGQRARVSLARVVYGEEDIILLDDPLSAVDTKCAAHIFNRLIKEYLQEKTVLLVTHNTEFLSQLDYIYLMNRAVKEGDEIVGRIAEHGTWEELNERDLIKEQAKLREEEDKKENDEDETQKKKKDKPKQVKEDRRTGLIDKRMYFKFWNLSFGWITCPIILVMVAGSQAVKILQEEEALTWVERVEAGDSGADSTFVTYVILAIETLVFYSLLVFFIAYAGTESSKALHNLAFNGMIKSPIRFFDITPIGILINRFSKDTLFCDERLSFVFSQFSSMFTSFVASMVILCISNYYFILILLPLLLFMTLVLHFYLKTSVEVRRVEATLRSPVLSHISGTLAGMSTIRASKQIEVYKEQHYRLRDRHTSAQMIFKATERWLSVRLDSIVTFIGFFATLICIFLRDTIGAKLAGLGIVYVQNRMGEFQYCIRLGAECENLMTAVERVFTLADLPPEEDPNLHSDSEEVVENNHSSADLKGVVEFRDVSLRYDKSLPFVLHNINFKTKSCEKIGIVGRTGAGKSSIIQALYRMCEVQGTVLIDGSDTSKQTLSELRGSISVIPQESLLFSGTLRDNLDPYLTFSDETLWNTLEQVQLKSYISGKGGLRTPIDEMGGNMSVGQRQLLCLARALLKKSTLLVVDEATANVDQETDEAIQKTIRTFFSDRTVLTIAHRLNTIIDSDRIMVMDSGHLAEFDTPDNLLLDSSSIFYSLVHGTDHSQTVENHKQD